MQNTLALGDGLSLCGIATLDDGASILSAAMLLDHFNLNTEAELIRAGVEKSLKLKISTPDINPASDKVTTSIVGDFIEDFIFNPKETNLNFMNIHLGQSTII